MNLVHWHPVQIYEQLNVVFRSVTEEDYSHNIKSCDFFSREFQEEENKFEFWEKARNVDQTLLVLNS